MKVESYDIHEKLGLVNESTYPENPIDRVAKEPTKEPVIETPTQKTTEQAVADIRAREQVDLRNAIPNIDDYRDSEGNVDESLLSGMNLQLYYAIYNKYDAIISTLLGIELNPKGKTKPTEESDKQEMEEEFEEDYDYADGCSVTEVKKTWADVVKSGK
jgi:hypothetical protein